MKKFRLGSQPAIHPAECCQLRPQKRKHIKLLMKSFDIRNQVQLEKEFHFCLSCHFNFGTLLLWIWQSYDLLLLDRLEVQVCSFRELWCKTINFNLSKLAQNVKNVFKNNVRDREMWASFLNWLAKLPFLNFTDALFAKIFCYK